VVKVFYIKDFLGVFEHEREKPYYYSAKKRPFDVLCFRAEGESHFFFENKEYISKKGSVALIPKNTDYSQKGQGKERLIAVHFVADRPIASGIRVFDAAEIPNLASVFRDMLNGYKNSGYTPTESLLSSLYYAVSVLPYAQALPTSAMEKAMAVFESHFLDTDFSVFEWASILGTSRTYLQKLCQQELRQTPCAYLQKRRLEYAAALLSSGEYKVKHIAFACGYYSEKNFLRAFSARFGMSASAYRKKHL
jgi:AraC-like DNA-binding protein